MMVNIFQLSWQVPFGVFSFNIDPLSVIFLMAIGILTICTASYGFGYMRACQDKKPLALHVFFYFLLILALVLVVTANNVILFLSAWEMMTISAYFLIIFNDEERSVRQAGFLYLIASHGATFFLFIMFFIMAHIAHSMDFHLMAGTKFSPAIAGTIFLLALIGFGVKAGFLPLHIWLPRAHPAAPSHVSALLSGVMIKMGIYGICRILWIVGAFPHWCAYLLLVIGIVSGVMGVLYALGQHELKKLLAYHSIENIGIIALGLGIGLLGWNYQNPFLAILGFGGGLLHVFNHSLFKGLLFLGAGSVIQKTHSGEMDELGGLAKAMPLTSALFLIGALSICGLPLFNGFISEFIIYFGFFQGFFNLPLFGVMICSLGIVALALMGALALACFCKVFGIVFLGHPRTAHAANIQPVLYEGTSRWMTIPMMFLAGLCIWIGVHPQPMARFTLTSGAYLAHASLTAVSVEQVMAPLTMAIGVSFLFFALVLGLVIVRRSLLGPLSMATQETWSCGFSHISSRAQYTSSSFARLIIDFVQKALLFCREEKQERKYFPGKASMASSVHDAMEEKVFSPFFLALTRLSQKIDLGRVRYTQIYLMYIFLFLIFLLVWKLK